MPATTVLIAYKEFSQKLKSKRLKMECNGHLSVSQMPFEEKYSLQMQIQMKHNS